MAVALLALSCSSKSAVPDASDSNAANDSNDNSADVTEDHFVGLCPGGFPCCSFIDPAGAAAGLCDAHQCMVILDGGTPSANGCVTCPAGTYCASLCPSPNGGCGGPATCCPAQ